jgi:hypothetical protein
MYANSVKGKIAIVISIFVILLGIGCSVVSSHSEKASKGVDIGFGYTDNGTFHQTTDSETFFENPEAGKNAKFTAALAVVLYVGGGIGIIYGISLCLKGTPKD